MANQTVENKLKLLPDQPGSYQMKDANGKIIYVGKAKNLKNRVRSYFKSSHTGKTAELVENIADFEFIVTNSDKEAFLLENELIKQYKPYYNIRLKYGNSYPYIEITHEKDPRIILANTIKKDGGNYFGPYPNVYAAQETLHFLKRIYPLRACNGYQGRPCLYYSMGQCLGACWRDVPASEYQENIDKISNFLNGDIKDVKKEITNKMTAAADNMDYEVAADLRDRLKFIEQTVENQTVLINDNHSYDVFNYYMDKGWMTVQIFFVRQNRLLRQQKETFSIVSTAEEELETLITQFYQNAKIKKPYEILVPKGVDVESLSGTLETRVRAPYRGEKKSVVDLAAKNAQITLEDKFRLMQLTEQKTTGAMQEISEVLGVPRIQRIEAFDHSNTQGTNYVSAMVVFEDGVPNKSLYRKYKLKTLNHQDEAAATQEVIRRRYSRLLKEKAQLPDLVLMDGGEIQLNAAKEVIEDELGLNIPVAAMVKNDKHQTSDLISGETGERLFLDKNSQGFFLLQRIQDEVHRFVITFHRQLRTKTNLSSRLDEINGVGPKTRNKLMKEFGSLEKIANASLEEIEAQGVSKKTASLIKISLQAILKDASN
ncbi:MAG: excinuclease ABC subunit UvrC [Lactobacillaceae bacterium]|jgi:excinuclease ABC subunit C|nr:excinuclease ABC subunit UvrC [Lactobacillaceae bacterium]